MNETGTIDRLLRFEVLRQAINAVAEEMALTIIRCAHSAPLRESLEFSTAICTPSGKAAAQSLTLPIHAGAIPGAMEKVWAQKVSELEEGDVLFFNDPRWGGLHLPDIFVMAPVIHDSVVIAIVATTAHHADIGGRVPGGNAVDSRSIYEEGIIIPPTLLYKGGVIQQPVVDLLTANVRFPGLLLGDLSAQVAACRAGIRQLRDLASAYGPDSVTDTMEDLIRRAAAAIENAITALPEGRYEFVDHLDDNGTGAGDPIRIQVSVEITGGEIVFDFTGSSGDVASAVNCPESYTRSACACILAAVTGTGDYLNQAAYDKVRLRIPDDSVVRWRHPSACAARGLTMYRICDALLGAFGKLSDKVPAAGDGGACIVTIAGTLENGQAFGLYDPVMGSWGATSSGNGVDGVANLVTNSRNIPVEQIEIEFPVRIRKYSLIADSGGDGAYRGGLSVEREYEILTSADLVVRSDRRLHPPFGSRGGLPGSPSNAMVKRPGQTWSPIPSKWHGQVEPGTRFRLRTAGGGGWGAPSANTAIPSPT